MPSKSKAQERFMNIAAHNVDFAKRNKIDQDVAKEFHEADKAKEAKSKQTEKKAKKK